ncbi:ATP-binding cassette domain-containing protein [Crossiella sp. CA-258035]|uniref:ATP-binding cassette domain-containing protein n=1 Tax=Crossiella sp. CA-258035 TaxID=2981138 RepID=UPI0024BCE344|nr:ATP-binding cassette domain-containing protein [Crossiella sp. CA-258035]WHT22664.1 ATP-binding cassette domain-containing protein [Crossiella sp. CA-258035]
MIHVKDLRKSFGATTALAGVDLTVPRGQVFGLLGPNGAGKTTTVRVLTTLLRADSGTVRVAGHDVRTDPQGVRRAIGLSGQYAAVDDNLTGRENLLMVGLLYGMRRKVARRRADELLERFRLTTAANNVAKSYSGGMRRRLDLAGAFVGAPPVVVLDEPTTGLDPRSRQDTWAVVGELVAEGTTVLLTTQYLAEADEMADRIAVLDQGRVIATGTAEALKARAGQNRLTVVVADHHDLPATTRILDTVGAGQAWAEPVERKVSVPVTNGAEAMKAALRLLDAEHIDITDLSVQRPTLDDVFLTLTGHPGSTSPEPAGSGAR